MNRLLPCFIMVLFALPIMQAEGAGVNAARPNAQTAKKPDPEAMKCNSKDSSTDPAAVDRCNREISAAVEYLTTNDNGAMEWFRKKSQKNPKLLQDTMAYCSELITPAGEVPSLPALHQCARQRLGP